MKSSKAYGISPVSQVAGGIRSAGRILEIDRQLLRILMKGVGSPAIRVALWDGKEIVGDGAATSKVVIRTRSALLRLLINPFLYFGDDYAAGNVEVEGGLVPFVEAMCRATAPPQEAHYRAPRTPGWYREAMNSLASSKKNIHHHYDLGNDFYRLWLDEEMLYTCAYFPDPALSLEAAQLAKMELVCRKLRLKGGERVIEAGCGWGGLARYMAKRYGAKVRAFNISGEQISYARRRAQEEGIEGVEFIEDDYRNIRGECDVFVSVGMLEHVGPSNYRRLGKIIDSTLTGNGFGLIHSIGQDFPRPMSGWLEKRIFPGSYPPSLREMMEIFEPFEFTVLDVENLRLHYARTLEHWLERFDRHVERVTEMFDPSFVRAWRLYLSGSIANFTTGSLQLFQVLFSRQGNNQLAWNRDHLLSGSHHPSP